MKRALLIAAVLSSALALGCRPSAGGSCKVAGREVCVDADSALACQDGQWTAMACRGPLGCATSGGDPQCDQASSSAGETCNVPGDHVCAADGRGVLRCTERKWVLARRCLGEGACAAKGEGAVACDDSVGNAGDPCEHEGDYACAVDGKAVLACRGGAFVQEGLCKGPKGCAVVRAGGEVACDDSLAAAGDRCGEEEHYTCSTDGRAILKCRRSKFELDTTCKAKEACDVRGFEVGCY